MPSGAYSCRSLPWKTMRSRPCSAPATSRLKHCRKVFMGVPGVGTRGWKYLYFPTGNTHFARAFRWRLCRAMQRRDTTMTDPSLLGPWVRRFLLEHLVGERNLARNTQRSYRDTLALLIPFIADKVHKQVD